ncbi:MAG: hypothetical protein ABI197_14270 [Granulicella sp.]
MLIPFRVGCFVLLMPAMLGSISAQSPKQRIPIYVECSCPDKLGKVFEAKLKMLISESVPYRLAPKSEAIFRYVILSVDGDKTKLAPTGQLAAISTLITGDRNEWVHHAVYAVTQDTVDEAAQNDLRSLSDEIVEGMRQKN